MKRTDDILDVLRGAFPDQLAVRIGPAARTLGLSVGTIRNYLRDGILPPLSTGTDTLLIDLRKQAD